MVLVKLAISNFVVRKVRTALTVCAIALSVSLVVAVTSGYKSMEAAALKYLNQYMGAADAFIQPGLQGQMPEKLVNELAADPDVRNAFGRLESQRELPRKQTPEEAAKDNARPDHTRAGGIPGDMIGVHLIGIRRPGDTQSETLDTTSGKWFNTADGNVCVIDELGAEKLGVNVGDTISLPGLKQNVLDLKVVGLVHKPTFFSEHSATVYLPIETLQHFAPGADDPPKVSRIAINLHPTANFDAFKERWTKKLAAVDAGLRLHMTRDNAGTLENNLRVVHVLSYFGGVVSMVTAMFIIFSSLSMGVTERQRTLAMLRAIGALRSQIARLVVLEAIALAIVGVVAGILLGMLWTELIDLRYSDLFSAGAIFSGGGMLFAAVGSILTALAASLMPAWWASRVKPMEAMSAQASSPQNSGPPIKWALLGIFLACLDPFLFFGPLEKMFAAMHVRDTEGLAASVRFFGHFVIGLPGVIFGFFLMAPLFLWVIERLFAPLVATVLGIPVKLLRQQLSSGTWRAAGTGAALMVGLATLIVMQVQGNTLIGSWRLPDNFPDIFIKSSDFISWKDQALLEKVPGIAPGSLMPVVVTTPSGDSSVDIATTMLARGAGGYIMFFGVNPEQTLGMIELEFRDNDGKPFSRDEQLLERDRVIREMKLGRHIIVTDEFRQARHVKIGDTIQLHTSKNGIQNYTICGIVWSPGVDVIISLYDLGHMLDQQTAGSVFGSIEDAKRDYGATGAWLFAANLQGGIAKENLLKEVQKALGNRGLMAGDVRQIKYNVEKAFQRILLLISSIAFAAMAVASLGVTNTVMSSVRTRRWQFGILRSVGVSRGGLLRLVLCEAVLLALLGIALGVLAGLELSVDVCKLGGDIMGYTSPMNIPWNIVGMGCLTVFCVTLIASLWPAISVSRTEILKLLQGGRASS